MLQHENAQVYFALSWKPQDACGRASTKASKTKRHLKLNHPAPHGTTLGRDARQAIAGSLPQPLKAHSSTLRNRIHPKQSFQCEIAATKAAGSQETILSRLLHWLILGSRVIHGTESGNVNYLQFAH